jgi:hypothetical protein
MVEFGSFSLGLFDHMIGGGCRRAIIGDAIINPEDVPGSTWCRPMSAVETRIASHLDSTHDAPLPAAIEAGRARSANLPSTSTSWASSSNVAMSSVRS